MLDNNKLRQFTINVRDEVKKIQAGHSQYHSKAIHFDKGISPALNMLGIFEAKPSQKTLDEFLGVAKQDFGSRAADAFKTWAISLVFEDTVVKPPKAKSFADKLGDVFYGIFKAAGLPLTPDQYEKIQGLSDQMAMSFTTEIAQIFASELAKAKPKRKEIAPQKVPAKTKEKEPIVQDVAQS